jgi:predicted phage terminase large subunit-like protein
MSSVDAWKTTRYGGYTSVGVGGGLTGKGASILVIDDSLKDRAEAESETVKNGVWDWYRSVAYTRLTPGGGVIVIGTRWASDDLTGRILETAEESGENWRIMSYPAIAEEDDEHRKVGEALHPDRYDIDTLNRIRRTLGERDWASLYQQRPVPDSGNLFKREMFRPYKEHPPLTDMGLFSCWDVSTGQGADYSVGIVAGIDRNSDIYVIDLVRGRFSSLELCEKILETHDKYGLQRTGIEIGQISSTIEPILDKMMSERKKYITIDKLKPGRANKVARAMSIIARMEQGKVLFPVNAPWFSYYQTELMNFPAYKNDDCVDSTAYMAYMMDLVYAPQEAKEKPKPSWKDRLKRLGVRGGTTHMSA